MKRTHYIILAILVFFHLINNIVWLKKDTSFPNIDNSLHLTQSLILYLHLKNLDFHLLNKVSSYYPPLYPLTSSFLYFLFGTGKDVALYVNLIFFSLTLVFTFLVGKEIKGEKTGILSSFLVSFYPIVFLISREYYIDILLTLTVITYLYFLIICEKYKNRIHFIVLGINFALGMLTKWTFVFFVIVPTFGVFLKREYLCKKNIFNLLIFLFISSSISSLWYLPNAISLLKNLQLGNLLDAGHDPGPFSKDFYIYYLKSLWFEQLYPVFSVLFLIGFVFFLFKKKETGEKMLLSHFLSSYLFFTFIFNKDMRFTIPYLPTASIITAIFLQNIMRKSILFLLLLFSTLQFFIFSYYVHPPQKMKDREVKSTVKFIKNDILKKERRAIFILIDSDNPSLNLWTFKYYFFRDFLDYLNTYYIQIDGIGDISKYDYVVIKHNPPKKLNISEPYRVVDFFTFEKDKFYLIAKQQ